MTPCSPRSQSDAGFTLVEMLLALAIFALLAGGGVAILRASVNTQAAVKGRLSELGMMGRANALLSSDLAQAVDRPTRAPTGQRPAFEGDSAGMAFVRAGWANFDDTPRSSLQRISWRAGARQLTRTTYQSPDGDESVANVATLARAVEGALFRYRDSTGNWASTFRSTEQHPLPRAVEVTITTTAGTGLVMIIALPQPGQPTAVAL